VVASSEQSIEESVVAILAYLEQAGILTYEKKHDA
ncbi:adenylyl-sulfate kinase, partial [Mesorhizobium sp. M00.F.Ca.ET.186.01.1.1]